MWSLKPKTPPSAEPLDVDNHVVPERRLMPEVAELERDSVEAKIRTARELCEDFTRRQLITATWTLLMDSWWEPGLYAGGAVYLPRPPLQSISSIKYVDDAGDQQTWALTTGYVVDAPDGPHAQRGRFYPAYDQSWPELRAQPQAVEVEFVAGYGAEPEAVPDRLRSGMLLIVGELYERREEAAVGPVSPNVLRARDLWRPLIAHGPRGGC